MLRPLDSILIDTVANFTTHDPIIPYGIFAVNSDGSGFKLGNGIDVWSALSYQGGNSIGSKQVQTSREPANNELLLFCESTDKWVYRLQHCFDSVTNWASNSSVFPTSTMLIETDDITGIPTGRFKIGDGATAFPTLPWFGADFDTSLWSAGEGIEFNGAYFEPATYLKPTELQVATVPSGKFHRDDGSWASISISEKLDSIEADYASFGTVYIGGFPTESTTVTLTSDGVDLFSDGNKVWTAYNDGDGSGLDADTLDGHHADTFLVMEVSGIVNNFVAFGTTGSDLIDSNYSATSFATTDHVHTGYLASDGTAVDSDKLDGYDSTHFATTNHTHATATATTGGFLPILENTTTKYLRDDGTWQSVTGSDAGDVTGPATSIVGNIVTFNSTDGKSISDSGSSVSDFATTGDIETVDDDAFLYAIIFGG